MKKPSKKTPLLPGWRALRPKEVAEWETRVPTISAPTHVRTDGWVVNAEGMGACESTSKRAVWHDAAAVMAAIEKAWPMDGTLPPLKPVPLPQCGQVWKHGDMEASIVRVDPTGAFLGPVRVSRAEWPPEGELVRGPGAPWKAGDRE